MPLLFSSSTKFQREEKRVLKVYHPFLCALANAPPRRGNYLRKMFCSSISPLCIDKVNNFLKNKNLTAYIKGRPHSQPLLRTSSSLWRVILKEKWLFFLGWQSKSRNYLTLSFVLFLRFAIWRGRECARTNPALWIRYIWQKKKQSSDSYPCKKPAGALRGQKCYCH